MTLPIIRRPLVTALLVAVLSSIGIAQTGPYARDPKQPLDEAYTQKIKEYTTEPFFLSPLVDYLPASKTVPTPVAVLGDIAGAPGKLPYAEEVHEYMRMVEKASPRVKVYSIGTSEEGREMIAVAVSSHNKCYYCLVAHGAAVRALSGDPPLGEMMAMNYRAAKLPKRQRAMLDFAVKLTAEPWAVEEHDREALRRVSFTDRDIWDIAAVAGFFNMSNRVASATDMRPNTVYHSQAR